MSYIDAQYDSKRDKVRVVERVNGERIYRDFKADHHFYITDPDGKYTSMYGSKVKRIDPKSKTEKEKLMSVYRDAETWESDVNPINRCLEEHYSGAPLPKMNVAFFDIETDFNEEYGYSSPHEAFNPITSIATYLQWQDEMICLAIPPKGTTQEQASIIAEEVGNTYICKNEAEMLMMFIEIVEDADVVSGWNSNAYDIPYIVNRITKLMGKSETRKICLWDQFPRKRKLIIGGKEDTTYDLKGRIHLDYMELYKQYNFDERHSYALDSIAEIELGEKKVEYKGTLDDLYKKDFKKFLKYNIQDTMLLDKLDKKLKFIDLTSTIAHGSTVLISASMGAVAVTEQSIINEAHKDGLVVKDRSQEDIGDESKAAGGWVAWPKKGMHKWIGSADLASLYPSVIRSFNMSPETIVGQVRPEDTWSEIKKHLASGGAFSTWWNDRFNTLEMETFLNRDPSEEVTVDFETGDSIKMTGAELHDLVFSENSNLCITANGTIIRTDTDGIIPALLAKWYQQRKDMKRTLKRLVDVKSGTHKVKTKFNAETDSNKNEHDNFYYINVSELEDLIDDDCPDKLQDFFNLWGLTLKGNQVVPKKSAKDKWNDAISYWDKTQLVKKINLNSIYGGLLNEYCRFNDHRIGQSTTLSGRSITKHMAAKTNEIITGKYDHSGDSIIYGDTDSVYYSAYSILKDEINNGEIEWTKESVIDLYDNVAKEMDKTFPSFLQQTFNVPKDRSSGVITAEREVVGSSGIFSTKKRYAILVYDDEGERKDVGGEPGKIKAMGLDLRRSDTPKFVQEFLVDILMDALTNKGEDHVIKKIAEFKEEFSKMKPWEKGTPKKVNNLTKYTELYYQNKSFNLKGKKATIPGHVMASINWNRICNDMNDRHTMRVVDGQKVIVCRLKKIADMNSIAYPVDETRLPEWFKELPFDDDFMMERLVDMKVKNLLGVLKWDFQKTGKKQQLMQNLFDYSAIK